MRSGEAYSLSWQDVDLRRGAVRLDKNKTDDPRAWALAPGVARALATYKALLRAEAQPTDLVFVDPHGGAHSAFGAAELLRSHLKAIGLKDERPELFETNQQRRQMRVHDLRGTFVTVSLANGKSETWVSDRTGHESSEMINNYGRIASMLRKLNLSELASPDAALAELRGATLAGGVGHGWARKSENSENTGRPQGGSERY